MFKTNFKNAKLIINETSDINVRTGINKGIVVNMGAHVCQRFDFEISKENINKIDLGKQTKVTMIIQPH